MRQVRQRGKKLGEMLRAVRLRSPSKSSLVCTQIAESFPEEILIRTNWRNAAQSWLVVPDFQSYQQAKKAYPKKENTLIHLALLFSSSSKLSAVTIQCYC